MKSIIAHTIKQFTIEIIMERLAYIVDGVQELWMLFIE